MHFSFEPEMHIKMKKLLFGLLITALVSSCSVQQFAVNTKTQPFENGGRIFGEKTKVCGENARELEYRKGGDLLLLGINVKKSDAAKLAKEMNANSYTIETKSNLIVYFITFGMVDYKIVKVIKRDN